MPELTVIRNTMRIVEELVSRHDDASPGELQRSIASKHGTTIGKSQMSNILSTLRAGVWVEVHEGRYRVSLVLMRLLAIHNDALRAGAGDIIERLNQLQNPEAT